MMRRRGTKHERGAVLLVVAACLVVVLLSGALAVDLSAQQLRAQDLQNTADAAALAGVAKWVDSADQAATIAAVNDLVAQNDIDPADVDVDVEFVDANTVRVAISDPDPQIFFSGVAPGTMGDVTRAATANFEKCAEPCGAVIPIPEPFLSINAIGSGDGFLPIVVGNRLYGVNHHGDTMACVDRLTQAACFVNADLFPSWSGYETDWSVSEGVVGTRIYWLGQSSADLSMFCWETVTDLPCLNKRVVASLPGGNFRGGALTAYKGRLYVVTDDHRMHCFNPASNGSCPGFPMGGLPTGLASIAGPLAKGDAKGNYDRVVDPATGRIYYVMKVGKTTATYTQGTYIDCWDTTTQTPCWNFTPSRAITELESKGSRLFLYHPSRPSPVGTVDATGVCMTSKGRITCFDLAGVRQDWMRTEMLSLEADLEDQGTHLYHPPTNRLVLQAGGLNLCWDFDAKVRCGSLDADWGKDYGFAYEGNCIFALGHNSRFWSFSLDFENGCPGTSTNARIDKCQCGGVDRWPNPTFQFALEPFTQLEVIVTDPDGNVVWPPDGLPASMLSGAPMVNLGEVSTDYPYLIVQIVAELDPDKPDPWDEDTPPEIILEVFKSPRLTS